MTDGPRWEDTILSGLAALTLHTVPALEFLTFDRVTTWAFSPANPGDGYGAEQAAVPIDMLLTSLLMCQEWTPDQQPTPTDKQRQARRQIVAGSRALADQGDEGITTTITRLIPAMTGELTDYAGDPANQSAGCFIYLLSALAAGPVGGADLELMQGVHDAYVGWDEQLAAGWRPPWQDDADWSPGEPP